MFSLIACIGKNRELGKQGKLIFHCKEDMQFFKRTTEGHKVVMGRKTWESLPKKLSNRENIVISRGEVEGADRVVHDAEAFIQENRDTKEEIFVIGGGEIYAKFLPAASKVYLTEVDAECLDADTYFPELNKGEFKKQVIQEGKENDLAFSICQYQR